MAYKTVIERILDCDFDKLMNEFFILNRNEELTEPNEKYCEVFRRMIDNIRELTPTKQEYYINADYDNDVVNDISEWNGFSINPNSICLKMIDVYAEKVGDFSKYSFKWNEWEECLGYKVTDELVSEFGLETLVAVILWEMVGIHC